MLVSSTARRSPVGVRRGSGGSGTFLAAGSSGVCVYWHGPFVVRAGRSAEAAAGSSPSRSTLVVLMIVVRNSRDDIVFLSDRQSCVDNHRSRHCQSDTDLSASPAD